MAIYTRWGDEVTIVAFCGEHDIKEFSAPVSLLEIEEKDGRRHYRFLQTLRADDGLNEIVEAATHAPYNELGVQQLATAIAEAL